MLQADPSRFSALLSTIPPGAWITIYGRVSGAAQVGGHGITRQIEEGRRIVESLGREPDEILIDEGFSAYKGDHLRFGKLGLYIDNAKSLPKGSVLVVEKVDRLTRERTSEFGEMLFRLINSEITIICYADGRVYSAEHVNENFFHLMMAFSDANIGNKESEKKSYRLSKAWAEKRHFVAKQDFSKPFQPYTTCCPSWLEWKVHDKKTGAGMFVEIPAKVAVVRRIFEYLIAGMGRDQIAKQLNIAGIAPWDGGKSGRWQGGCVFKVTDSRLVLGEYQMHTHEKASLRKGTRRVPWGEPLLGYYPAVISAEVWRAARAAADGRRLDKPGNTGGRKGTKCGNLFTNRAVCSVCGGALRIKDGRNRARPKFKCRAVEEGTCTNTTLYPYPVVEESILAWASDYAPSIAKPQEVGFLETELAALKLRRDADKARRMKMLEQFGDDDDAQATEVIGRLKAKIASLNAEISTTEHKLDQARRVELAHRSLIQEMPGKLAAATNDAEVFAIRSAVRESLKEIIDRVVFHPAGYRVEVIGGEFHILFDVEGNHLKTRYFIHDVVREDHPEGADEYRIRVSTPDMKEEEIETRIKTYERIRPKIEKSLMGDCPKLQIVFHRDGSEYVKHDGSGVYTASKIDVVPAPKRLPRNSKRR